MKKLVIYGLSPNNGGIESYIYSIAPKLIKEYEIILLVGGNNLPCYYEELHSIGCRFAYFPGRKEGLIKSRRELTKFFIKEKPDILHYNISSLSYITPLLIAAKFGCKIVLHAHNSARSGRSISYYLHTLHKTLLKKTKYHLVAVSQEAAKWCFGNHNNVTVLDNGVNVERFQFSDEKRTTGRQFWGVSDNEQLIIHVGAFKYQKNHEFIIKLFDYYYYHYNSNSKLFLVGSGPLLDDVKKMVKEFELNDKVFFLGARNDIDLLLCAGDTFVFPSITEGFPISLIEAETTGIRCVVSEAVIDRAIINDYCTKLSLNDSMDVWCNSLQEDRKLDRKMASLTVKSLKLDMDAVIENVKTAYEH